MTVVEELPGHLARGSKVDSIGRWLRQERELRQISLEELAQTTRIPLKMLQHLEEDRHDQLPGEIFARGFLRSYARAAGIPEGEVAERWAQHRRPPEPSPALLAAATLTPPERSRRFGIAIALVILLILFTLAISIVLRPRQRDTPVELSRLEQVERPLPFAPGGDLAPGGDPAGRALDVAERRS
jgi:cytoskeletal protein RodZ